jgi:serine/threonine protein kinase KIN1/2
MLAMDPKQRASMPDILGHPWILKGNKTPVANFVPTREPLTCPLDGDVIKRMTGFDLGTPSTILQQLTRIIESDEYQAGARLYRTQANKAEQPAEERVNTRSLFGRYGRSRSGASDLSISSAFTPPAVGVDPLNAYDPLVSIYYLVREKMDRDDRVQESSRKTK